jgi:polar amino acid transport system substrate-binding protein
MTHRERLLANRQAALRRPPMVNALLAGVGVTLLALCGAATVAHAAVPTPAPDRPVRVATGRIAPFVIPEGGRLTGFSIDLGNELARRLRVEFAWTDVGPSAADQIQAVRLGDADVAISAITITQEREKMVDFSHPYFDSGLQIMVRARTERPLLDSMRSLPWAAIAQLFGAAIFIMLVLANVLWLIERRRGRTLGKGYLSGIGEGLWGAALIIATGEHGDRDAPGALKRILVVSMWLLGVVLIAQLTATVTSSQTVQRLQSSIQGPGDLPGKTIATAPGSIAAEYLARLGLPYVEVTTVDDALDKLSHGQVQAIVFDAPTLQYWAAKRGQGLVQVVGPVFRPEKYGIVVAEGSALRKRINEALFELYEDGTYDQIRAKWFSRAN